MANWLRLPPQLRSGSVFAAVAVVLLGFVFLAWHTYRIIDRELTDTSVSRRLSLAQLAAATLTEKFDGLIHIGTSLATRVQFRRLIAAGEWAQAGEILRGVPDDYPFIQRIFLTDPAGTETADVPHRPGGIGKNFAHRDWYRGVSRNWEPYVSEVYRRAALPRINVFAVAVPIRDGERILGILVLQQELEGFFSWADGLDIGPGGFVYVVDGNGRLAFHPRYPPQGEIVDFSEVPVVKKLRRREQGVAVVFNPVEQEQRLSAYVPIRHGWGVVAQQPAATAFAAKNQQLRRILIGYIVLLVFCAIVVWLIVKVLHESRQIEEDRHIMAELEQRVAARTTELEAVNRELESFSYSVSHDLRAPLRGIEGFSSILEENYGDKLDAEGRRLFRVVRDSARKMSLLIDDLLAFSRLGRQEIRKTSVNMENMVRHVFDEATRDPAAPKVQFTANPLPPAQVDPGLLKQVWFNLISNAIKYSGARRQPAVEVGGYADGGELVYYVRDNGAGFNMDYYDKLFSVFQRLHSEDEFPGTGVGLATVQRIIARHGGRVWAEGKIDEGATFYFSLPDGGDNGREHRAG